MGAPLLDAERDGAIVSIPTLNVPHSSETFAMPQVMLLCQRPVRPPQPALLLTLVLFLLVEGLIPAVRAAEGKQPADPFARENLVAWCIVPFDSRRRTPAERADLVAELGLKRVAYDWRAEHVPTFETEIREYQRRGIEYFAFWGVHDEAYRLFVQYDLHPQIWQTAPSPAGDTDEAKVKAAVAQLLPLVDRTRKMGCQLGLYNHGGWGGEPANLVAVCRQLREQHDGGHVGIVYNLHHGHDHIEDFAASLAQMQPYLLCLNLNGMNRHGDERGQKILLLGAGEADLQLLRIIRDSGYRGPIGIIGHTQDDVGERLRDNLDGLEWLRRRLAGEFPPTPQWRTWKPAKTATE